MVQADAVRLYTEGVCCGRDRGITETGIVNKDWGRSLHDSGSSSSLCPSRSFSPAWRTSGLLSHLDSTGDLPGHGDVLVLGEQTAVTCSKKHSARICCCLRWLFLNCDSCVLAPSSPTKLVSRGAWAPRGPPHASLPAGLQRLRFTAVILHLDFRLTV